MREDAIETNAPPSSASGLLNSSDTGPWDLDTELGKVPDLPAEGTNTPVSFFHFIERLKSTKREGWRRFGLMHGESISDHMYRMSIMTMLAPPSLAAKLDIARCTKMALIHDMAEALVGDLTPVDGVSKPEKSRREAETMDYLCKRLLGKVDGGSQAEEIKKVWREYEDSETPESIFVHDIDKVELMHQMVEYEKRHEGRLNLAEFAYVAKKIQLPEVKVWADQVLQEREDYWTSLGYEKAPEKNDGKQEHEKKQDAYYGKP